MNRISARASEVSGQVTERMGQVTERMQGATQRAVLPITVTCTVALSSGAMGASVEPARGTRSGTGSAATPALTTRTRERSTEPRRLERPRHQSARPRAESRVRRARSQEDALADVRRVDETSQSESIAGQAAPRATRPARALGVRERFALWRLRELARRSRNAPSAGAVKKAVAALEHLERVGPSGAYRRWRANVQRRRGFRTAAVVAAARGDFEAARASLERARQASPRVDVPGPLLGSSDQATPAAEIYDRAMRLAGRFAARGRPDLTQEIIDFAAEVAIDNRLSRRVARHEQRSARLLRAAKQNLIQELLRRARERYRAGRSGAAWSALAEAREVKTGWSARLRSLAGELEEKLVESCDACSLPSIWDSARDRGAEPRKAQPAQRPKKSRRHAPVFRGGRGSITPGASAAGSSHSRGTTSSWRGGSTGSRPTSYDR